MTPEELAQRSADEILKTLGRDEETLKAMLRNKQRGGWRWTDEELEKELVLAGVVRILKGQDPAKRGKPEDPGSMNPSQLQKEIEKTMNRLFSLRQALSRKTGDVPNGRKDINFEKYVTE